MNIRTFLNLTATTPILEVTPEGKQVLDTIAQLSDTPIESIDLTGQQVHEWIQGLPLDVQKKIYATELNDGVDLSKYRKELESLLDSKDSQSKWLRHVIAFGMSTLLACTILAISFSVIWVSIYENTLPSWELCLIAIGGPAMVVWQYNGVLTQERKDLLAAALGRTPQVTLLSKLFNPTIQRRKDDTHDPH